jgi:hypothetical protein
VFGGHGIADRRGDDFQSEPGHTKATTGAGVGRPRNRVC